MSDYVVRGTAANLKIRCFAIDTTEMAEKARVTHGLSPVMTAALGRFMSAAAMMGSMMKGEKDVLTLQIRSDGPAKGMTVTADSHGNVKGFVNVPDVDIPLKEGYDHKLDVGGAIGPGTLSVALDLGLKEPYNGMVELQTGEIAEDMAYYFTVSEQTPSAVGLGVMVDTDCSVRHSGGYVIQLMPDAGEEEIQLLEQKLSTLPPVTTMMDEGMTPEQVLTALLGDQNLELMETKPVQFHCNCSKEHVAGVLSTLSSKELEELINDGEQIEVKCYFCNSAYTYTVDDLKEIMESRNA